MLRYWLNATRPVFLLCFHYSTVMPLKSLGIIATLHLTSMMPSSTPMIAGKTKDGDEEEQGQQRNTQYAQWRISKGRYSQWSLENSNAAFPLHGCHCVIVSSIWDPRNFFLKHSSTWQFWVLGTTFQVNAKRPSWVESSRYHVVEMRQRLNMLNFSFSFRLNQNEELQKDDMTSFKIL